MSLILEAIWQWSKDLKQLILGKRATRLTGLAFMYNLWYKLHMQMIDNIAP